MKADKFREEVFHELNGYNINLTFLEEWYSQVVSSLKNIKKHANVIKHPRHLGDHLESEVSKVLESLLPQRYVVEKGFVINSFSAISKEQDLLVIDTALGSALCSTDGCGYYPVESAIGSIEIKSNLNLIELRKCFLNCASVKKLYYSPFEYNDIKNNRGFYVIFSYTSSCSLKSIKKEIAQSIKMIPESLRPNLIYILDKGLFIPTSDGVIALNLDAIQTVSEDYGFIENESIKGSAESQNIILLFSLLIEHAFQQSAVRNSTCYSDYVIRPSIWADEINKKSKKPKSVKKFVNKYVKWFESKNSFGVVVFEESCEKCKSIYKFYVMPPGTKEFKNTMEKSFESNGVLLLPKNKKYKCKCGCEISINVDEE